MRIELKDTEAKALDEGLANAALTLKQGGHASDYGAVLAARLVLSGEMNAAPELVAAAAPKKGPGRPKGSGGKGKAPEGKQPELPTAPAPTAPMGGGV